MNPSLDDITDQATGLTEKVYMTRVHTTYYSSMHSLMEYGSDGDSIGDSISMCSRALRESACL